MTSSTSTLLSDIDDEEEEKTFFQIESTTSSAPLPNVKDFALVGQTSENLLPLLPNGDKNVVQLSETVSVLLSDGSEIVDQTSENISVSLPTGSKNVGQLSESCPVSLPNDKGNKGQMLENISVLLPNERGDAVDEFLKTLNKENLLHPGDSLCHDLPPPQSESSVQEEKQDSETALTSIEDNANKNLQNLNDGKDSSSKELSQHKENVGYQEKELSVDDNIHTSNVNVGISGSTLATNKKSVETDCNTATLASNNKCEQKDAMLEAPNKDILKTSSLRPAFPKANECLTSDVCKTDKTAFKADSCTYDLDNSDELDNHQVKKKEKDPFDLFSDDETTPVKYVPLKRKHSSNSLAASVVESKAEVVDILEETVGAIVDFAAQKTPMCEDSRVSVPAPERESKVPKLDYRVVYIHSEELLDKVNKLARIDGRAHLVHSLIEAFGLLQYVDIVPPRLATDAEILGFHSADYIDFLKDVSGYNDDDEMAYTSKFSAEAEAYGLSYDCPLQRDVFETASLIGGASIVGAEQLLAGNAQVAVNWYGGWHHAKRDGASGFCYINDIVLGILKLREKYDKVLYVDIDLHHGDGVEEAFSLTSKVMTVSFHKYAAGFFPGTGGVDNVGSGRGKYYTVNVPLHDGIKDAEFCSVFFRVMKKVKARFESEAVVLQCGADGLSEDLMASFNLSFVGLAKCVCYIMAWNLPTLILGGGGYNFASTAKCWAFLTALVARRKLPLEIPEHENLLEYGPDYQMTSTLGNRRDCNTREYMDQLVNTIEDNLDNITR